jgi:hypothetical protein
VTVGTLGSGTVPLATWGTVGTGLFISFTILQSSCVAPLRERGFRPGARLEPEHAGKITMKVMQNATRAASTMNHWEIDRLERIAGWMDEVEAWFIFGGG